MWLAYPFRFSHATYIYIYICVTIIVAKKCLYTYVCMLDILSIYIYIMGGNDQYLISLTFFGQGLETSDR